MTLEPQLLRFIRDELASNPDAVDDNTQLIDEGILDSMALMRLITFLEERAGVRVPDDEVVPDNFQTIASIQQLVDRLQTRR
jgi:acyl carrier protein